MARDRRVVVSRGELVEIGGSFRVPDVISAGGAILTEVGTTNRTRIADYAAGVAQSGPAAAVLLRVHQSNFKQVGFTESPSRTELVALGRETDTVVVEDLGSGLLGPIEGAELELFAHETPVDQVVASGIDLVCFSGDKLLGGPQAGIVVGGADRIRALRAHPLYRALRLDKLGLVALEHTLRLYREGRAGDVPVRRMLRRSVDELHAEALALHADLVATCPGGSFEVVQSVSVSGGGSLPGLVLPSAAVAVGGVDPERLASELRRQESPIVGRIHKGRWLLDPRTLGPGEGPLVVVALGVALAACDSGG
jgi:L-seryl-tRNA(Ser) seleniumtransferase